jgi:hypothetical protein
MANVIEIPHVPLVHRIQRCYRLSGDMLKRYATDTKDIGYHFRMFIDIKRCFDMLSRNAEAQKIHATDQRIWQELIFDH